MKLDLAQEPVLIAQKQQRPRNCRLFLFLYGICLFAIAGTPVLAASGQDNPRPRTEDLLPETTVAFVQIANVREWVEKANAGSLGRMLADDTIAPVADRVWQELEGAYSEVQDQVGMSLDQIQSLPSGEIHIAVIAPRRKDLEYLIALEIDPDSDSAEAAAALAKGLIDKQKQAETEVETETTEDEITISSFKLDIGEGEPRDVSYFFRDGLLVASTSKIELLAVLDRWAGREVAKVRPLSRNRKFVTIMNRCQGIEGLPADMRFFVDPVQLLKTATRGNLAAQATINFLPVAGLDGVLGIGGSALITNDQFEQVMHGHLLLANPRSGVLEMFGLRPDQYEPDPWVPADVGNYIVTSWDVNQTLTEIGKLYDKINGTKGAFRVELAETPDKIGLDLQTDIIDVMDGRFTYFQWADENAPPTLNSTCNGWGIGTSDVEAAEHMVTTLLTKMKDNSAKRKRKVNIEEKEQRGIRYWLTSRDPNPERQKRINERMKGVNMRTPQMSITIIDGTIVICDSEAMIQRVIDVSQGEADSLAGDPEYQDYMQSLIQSAGTDLPCVSMWSRPDSVFREFLRLANDDTTRAAIAKAAETKPAFRHLSSVLNDQTLPDIETLQQYLGLSAAIVTKDDTGYHMLAVTFARDDD